jgi:nucleotide-binding universal stress UspA family protein
MTQPWPKRVLVPVEFEQATPGALQHARAIARATGADLCLLHVMPSPPAYVPRAADKEWMRVARRTLARLAARHRLPAGTSIVVLHGDVPRVIARYAAEEDFDLMVLSGRNKPDWHGSLLGSMATSILRHAKLPVVVVPAGRTTTRARREKET